MSGSGFDTDLDLQVRSPKGRSTAPQCISTVKFASMSSRVVQIVPKDPTVGMWGISRKVLSEAMERYFGPVVFCKKPPSSGNPAEDVAFIQFKHDFDAEKAVEQMKVGMALQGAEGMKLYGCEVTAHFKGSGGKDSGRGKNQYTNWNPDIEDSRALMQKRSGRRSRSRSRGGGRDSRYQRDRRDYDDRRDARDRRDSPRRDYSPPPRALRDYSPPPRERRGRYDEGQRDYGSRGSNERQRDDSRERGRGRRKDSRER